MLWLPGHVRFLDFLFGDHASSFGFPKAPLYLPARSKVEKESKDSFGKTGLGLFCGMGFSQTPKTLKPLLNKSDHPGSLRSEKPFSMWSDIHRLDSHEMSG